MASLSYRVASPRQVVARHAGTVAVHNREGGGTRFTVVLPGSSSPHGASSERRGTTGR